MVQAISPAVQQDYRQDLLVSEAPDFISSIPEVVPTRIVGAGFPRGNSRQAIKTFLILKAAGATTYTQVATATANTRIYFLGAQVASLSANNDSVYIEDASTGNISPTDSSTVALFYANTVLDNLRVTPQGLPRECKMGIRVRVVNGTAAAEEVFCIVYYLEERIDGQQVTL